jgi:uncharacterized protein
MDIPKNALNWFEIPVTDFEHAKKFYSALFAYDMPVTTMEEKILGFFPMERGMVGGATVKAAGYAPAQNGTLVYDFRTLYSVMHRPKKYAALITLK